MMNLCNTLLISLALAIPAFAAPELPEKEKLHLFLLAGQSNMAGRGKADDVSEQTDPRILALGKKLEWKVASDPLHWDKGSAGTGIGRPFAEIVAAKTPGVSIGLIPAACGGSPIKAWEPGQFWGQTKSHPWDDAIVRARHAMKDGTLKAILWHQGESDANPQDAPLYEERLTRLIARFRKELNAPNLPFIIGQLGTFPGKKWTPERGMIDMAHKAVAEKTDNVRFVPIGEAESIGDGLHFDTASLRRFAKGYAGAYLGMENP